MRHVKRIIGSKEEFQLFCNIFLQESVKYSLPYSIEIVTKEHEKKISFYDNTQKAFTDFFCVIADFLKLSSSEDVKIGLPLTTSEILEIFDIYLKPFDSDEEKNELFNFLKQASIGRKENEDTVICYLYGSKNVLKILKE